MKKMIAILTIACVTPLAVSAQQAPQILPLQDVYAQPNLQDVKIYGISQERDIVKKEVYQIYGVKGGKDVMLKLDAMTGEILQEQALADLDVDLAKAMQVVRQNVQGDIKEAFVDIDSDPAIGALSYHVVVAQSDRILMIELDGQFKIRATYEDDDFYDDDDDDDDDDHRRHYRSLRKG